MRHKYCIYLNSYYLKYIHVASSWNARNRISHLCDTYECTIITGKHNHSILVSGTK